ncbi:NAD-dependent epimerase/dehydratase family protein [Candidatus Nitrospira neomarina]|uniref:NAD-dependent epimerase/dehydratase family protein n=1 Tax=Candidatus Nitrospira neomarina TaxID=3020899 RepID=A0AA96JUK5_9BACT|nr:NAD-dependent epimerase/dehydratase family protein [Candidatus Nitrospira neomarina]WNM60687.1 NAD-dependent epimerase/dehydratase family protein [Candidatus Nitrospira neomarina]
MKSLVIGGTGQLGANLIRVLLERGDQVRVLHRSTSNTFTIDGLNVERVVGDLNDGESLRLGCEGRDVVYHTAGYYPSVTIPVEVAKGQALKETALVLEAVRAARVDRFVFASTLTTVGFPKTVGHPANETCQFSTRYTNNPYLMAKVAMEEKILQSVHQGIPAVVVIPTEFFGPYDQQPTSGTHILMLAKGRMPVYVPGRVNVIDVRDVAVAMIRAAERGRVGERYLVGNWNTTQKDLNELISQEVGVPPPFFPVPLALARWGAKAGEWVSRSLLRRPPFVPAFFVEVMAHMQHYDCSKAQRELDYPRSAPQGAIEDAVTWFRQNGYF